MRNASSVFSTLAMAMAMLLPALAFAEDDKHEFLFLLEEAYTQERQETQIGTQVFISLEDDGGWESEVEAEYGLTDRLQVSTELEIEKENGENISVEGVGFGIAYALFQESEGAGPTVSLAFEVEKPVGSEGGWELMPTLNISKEISDNVFLHSNLAMSYTSDDGLSGLDQWSVGAGIGWEALDETVFVLELVREEQASADFTNKVWAEETTGSFGVGYEVIDDGIIGIALAQTLEDDGETSLVFQTQYEW